MPPVRPWNAKKIARGVQPIEKMRPGATRSSFSSQRRYEPSNLNPVSVGADLLAITTGLVASFTVRIVGQLPASEVIALALLPVLLAVKAKKLLRPKLKPIYILLGLWLANQALTDRYRETATYDWLRGNASIIFFAIDLTFLLLLLGKNERRKIFFITSYAIGSLLAARFQPIELMEGDPWKFGYSTGCNLLLLVFAGYLLSRRQYPFAAAALVGVIVINVLENFRSPVLTTLMAAALTTPIVPEIVGNLRITPRKGTVARIVFLAVTAMIAGVLAHALVQLATNGGLISEDAQVKNKIQSQSRGGLLIAGRPEILVSSKAVIDHPILGLGSWARDFKYVEMLNDIQVEFGIPTDLFDAEQDAQGLVPAHSHLMGAWIWAGIFGAAFWAYLFWLSSRALIVVSNVQPPFALFYATMLFGFLFDVLFSPFNTGRRLQEAFIVVVIIDLLSLKVNSPAKAVPRSMPLRGRPARPFRASPAWRRSI